MPVEDYKTGKVKDMQLVGFDQVVERQAKLDLLEQVKLLDAGVSWCGDLGACPNLKALLLEQCLLGSWEPVAEMLQRLPALTTLSLAESRVGPISAPLGGPFKIQVMVLTNTGVTWSDCAPLKEACPELTDLFLRSNGLQLPPADLQWPGLKQLVLDDNGINDWGILASVTASFPDLHTLQLNDNALEDDVPDTVVAPAGLTALSLSNNLIRSYGAIGKLCGRAPVGTQLTTLRVAENPLSIDVNFRPLIIALMPQLTELNGSAVRARERVNGERTLLSLDVQKKPVAGEVDPDGTHRERLRAVHGDGIAGAEEVGNLSQSLVQVELVPTAADILGKPSVTKKIPAFLDISEFKVLAHKLFKVPLDHIRLVYQEEGAVVATALESGDLRAYGITNGAQVHVQDTRDDYENKTKE